MVYKQMRYDGNGEEGFRDRAMRGHKRNGGWCKPCGASVPSTSRAHGESRGAIPLTGSKSGRFAAIWVAPRSLFVPYLGGENRLFCLFCGTSRTTLMQSGGSKPPPYGKNRCNLVGVIHE